MKRYALFLMILCGAWLTGCNKDDDGQIEPEKNREISLMDGSIIINDHPDVTITPMNKFPESTSAETKRLGITTTSVDEPDNDLISNDYRFKLVAQVSTLKVDGVEVQATHVKITENGYAFVSYNKRGGPHRGGVVVFKYIIQGNKLEDVVVNVTAISSIVMPKAQVNAIDFFNDKLYMAGASSDPKFGYHEARDRFNYAFFMVMELNPDMTFKEVDPTAIKKLTSFQATSIRTLNNRISITTGDGTNGTDGGLYIFNASDYELIKFISDKQYARSVDADETNIFLMQSEPARVTKYDLEGNNEDLIYNTINESMQKDAKSEMLVWNKYLFVAVNESGLRMLLKENGELYESLNRPGPDPETDVTNSVNMNSDLKMSANGTMVQTNLLFLSNGEKGIYWYDVIEDVDGKDRIVACKNNSILGGTSANYIASSGNIVFVADGLGGLKILYIGVGSEDDTPTPPDDDPCPDPFKYDTFLKANGNDKGNPLNNKIGDVLFRVEGDNLVVYLLSNQKLNNTGVFFATSVDDFEKAGVLSGGGIVNGKMANRNADKRTVIDGGVKFTFAKSDLPEGELLCIVYCAGAWGYGIPYGSSGSTGNGSNNNSQYINIGVVTFCEP